MLIVTNKDFDDTKLSVVPQHLLDNAQYVTYEDLRWHKSCVTGHHIILLTETNQDISYQLDFLTLLGHAELIIVSDNPQQVSKFYRNRYHIISRSVSRDFFSGIYTVLEKQISYRLDSQRSFIETLSTAKFSLSTVKQAVYLSQELAKLSPQNQQLRQGLYELLINAFEHGIYNIGFDEKKRLINDKKYFSALRKLARTTEVKSPIELTVHKKADGVYINISDPGFGFDPTPYLNYNPDKSYEHSGRGIAYAANYCFDQMVYKNNGASVYAVVKH